MSAYACVINSCFSLYTLFCFALSIVSYTVYVHKATYRQTGNVDSFKMWWLRLKRAFFKFGDVGNLTCIKMFLCIQAVY